jgi:hypothetical protein
LTRRANQRHYSNIAPLKTVLCQTAVGTITSQPFDITGVALSRDTGMVVEQAQVERQAAT